MQLEKGFAQHYIKFLERIGASIEVIKTDSKLILTEDCKKIINGNINCKNKGEVENQLISTREVAGKWNIQLLNLLICDNRLVNVVQYIISSEKLGSFIVIAILKYNNMGLIEEINEVYHQR
jgi:hypothetical protein